MRNNKTRETPKKKEENFFFFAVGIELFLDAKGVNLVNWCQSLKGFKKSVNEGTSSPRQG